MNVLKAVRLLLFSTATCFCQPPNQSILCRDGSGTFDARFRTGVTVHIGASKGGEVALATRACAARLGWEKQELTVATNATQLDLDAFGVDFGDGVPSAAFQVKKSDNDCCAEYRIYSLEKPPRLLRTIGGGDAFRASDVDLDGRVEIWTSDAAAVNGFETLTLSELDAAPTVVLRLVRGQLEDVSAEFPSYFDDQVARIRQSLQPRDLQDFKNSDGRLAEAITPATADRLHRLRMTKVNVLEVIWALLYSGREQDAWQSLAEMWPRADADRIRSEILRVRGQGIHSQVNASSAGPQGKKEHAQVFNAVSRAAGNSLEVTPPQAILLEFPPSSEQNADVGEQLLDLVIDAAGKVVSAHPAGATKSISPEKIAAASTWKFIPAFRDSRPVASLLRISVSPKQ